MKNNAQFKALMALLIPPLAAVSILVARAFYTLFTTGNYQALSFEKSYGILLPMGWLVVLLWCVVAAVWIKWDWARRLVMGIALLVLGFSANAFIVLLNTKLGSARHWTLNRAGLSLEPITVIYLGVALLALVWIWAMAVVYLGMACSESEEDAT